MKLKVVPPRTGMLWVKLGIQTFFKQPLALAGLFFMFMAVISIASLVPLLGSALALALLPAATLGFMAASQEATKGKFPMPTILISAFRAGRDRMRAMLVLGALYALGFLLVMALSALFDGGQFAKLYLGGGTLSQELLQRGDFQVAAWVATLLYLPLSLLFWHAPALVHWHGVSPVKALFFSVVACFRNLGALTVYGLLWLGVFMAVGLVVSIIGAVSGSPGLMGTLLVPVALTLAAMFFTSIYFTFNDSFEADAVN